MFACRPQTESRVSAVCVCPQINVCAHSNRECSVDFFFCLCVHKHCMDVHTGKISRVFASVFGTRGLGYSVARIAEPRV